MDECEHTGNRGRASRLRRYWALVAGPVASFGIAAGLASATTEPDEHLKLEHGPASALECEPDDSITLESSDYDDSPRLQVPDTPKDAMREYVIELGPEVGSEQFEETSQTSTAALFVDSVDAQPLAAALATEGRIGWRVKAFAACSSYLIAHPWR